MHFQIPTILAFGVALAATTMALPTVNNNSTSTLDKRSHHGWVGSFTDPTCSGNPDPNGQRPKLGEYINSCTAFQYVVGDAVGVNFGSGGDQWEGVTFFSDDNCQIVSGFNNWHTVVPGSNGMACVQPAPGTVVYSVRGTDYVSK